MASPTRFFLALLTASVFSFSFGQQRMIGHISSTAGGFKPGIIIANEDKGRSQTYVLRPFTKSGEPLARITGTIAAGVTEYKNLSELFGREDVSHLVVEGDPNVLVSTTYQALSSDSTAVHVHEHTQQARRWRVYPGNWAVIWDGLAIVNSGDETSQVTIHQLNEQGQLLHAQQGISVGPLAKYLGVLGDQFNPIANCHFEIIADQPIAVTALRGSTDGRFLWVNQPVAQADSPAVFAQEQFTVQRTSNVAYGEGLTHTEWRSEEAERMELLLDIYEPVGAEGLRPVIVFIHGGGFFGGSKSSPAVVNIMNYFAARGFVGFSINYRLTGDKGTVPKIYFDYLAGQVVSTQTLDQTLAMYTAGRDAKAAIRWIRAHADTYQLDTQRITVAGGSAGAVTAIALGVSNPSDFRDELNLTEDPTLATTHLDQDDSVHTIIDFWGSGVMVRLLTDAYGHSSRWDASDQPIAIIHGTEDGTVPYSNALELVANYQQTGATYELTTLEGAGHSAWNALVDGKSLPALAMDFVVRTQQLRLLP